MASPRMKQLAQQDKAARDAKKAAQEDAALFSFGGKPAQKLLRTASQRGRASRKKGARGERDVIQMLEPVLERVYKQLLHDNPELPLGVVPRLQRNALQADGGGSDIAGLEWLALEVKNQETPQLPRWWKQCVEQARPEQTPVLFYKKNNTPWRVRMQVRITVQDYLPVWAPVVDMDAPSWLAYFSLRAMDEVGRRAWLRQKGDLT